MVAAIASFLETILPTKGVYYAAYPVAALDDKRSAWRHIPVKTAHDLARVVNAISNDGNDAYYAMASYSKHKYIDAKGKVKYRTRDNAAFVRAAWLDIDVGEDKPFRSQVEAGKALIDFVGKTKLPAPTYIVSSGKGLHVYWTWDEDVSKDQWQRIADVLSKVVRLAGFQVDSKPTRNVACVLRPAGTRHYKDPSNPKDVRIVRQGMVLDLREEWLPALKRALGLATRAAAAKAVDNSSLAGGMNTGEYPDSDAEQIITKCATLRHMYDTKGSDQGEQEWFDCLTVLAATVQGDDACHDWSSGYANYSHGETQTKLDYIRDNGYSPARCETIRLSSTHCDGCTQTCTSPIVLGYVRAAPAPIVNNVTKEAVPPMPAEVERAGYSWSFERGLRVEYTKPDGAVGLRTCCSQYPTMALIYMDDATGEFMTRWNIRVRESTWQEADIKFGSIGRGGGTLMQELAAKGGVVARGDPKNLEVYMRTWADAARKSLPQDTVMKTMGWINGGRSFVLGNKVYHEDGNVTDAVVSRSLAGYATAHTPVGSLQTYVDGVNYLYNRPGHQPYQFALMASYGSVLLDLVHAGNVGLVLSMHSSRSGKGKTSVALAGIGAWGDPTSHGQMASAGKMTDLGFYTMAGLRRHLPVLLDELTTWDADKIAKFAYEYSDGKYKIQAKAEGGLRDSSNLNWSNILYVTSNKSLVDTIAGTTTNCGPQIARVFELKFPDHTNLPVKDRDVVRSLMSNYGHAGAKFIKYVVKNREKVTRLVERIRAMLEDATGMDTDGRFWSLMCAVVYASFIITGKLGLHEFDRDAFYPWLVNRLSGMRDVVEGYMANADDTLGDMLSDLHSGIIVTIREGGGRDIVPYAPGYGPPRSSLVGRIVHEDGSAYISATVIRRWCAERGLDKADLQKALEDKGWLKSTVKRFYLGRGTHVPSAQVRCWHIKWPGLGQYIQDAGGYHARKAAHGATV